MPIFSFTVTQAVYDFTATISTPVTLSLINTQTQVSVTATTATIQVINQIQPVTVSGAQQFNQDLNTYNNVSFATVTVPTIFGFAQQPVYFPTGISSGYFNSLDFQNPNDP